MSLLKNLILSEIAHDWERDWEWEWDCYLIDLSCLHYVGSSLGNFQLLISVSWWTFDFRTSADFGVVQVSKLFIFKIMFVLVN